MNDKTLLFLPGASGNTRFWQPTSEHLRHPAQRRFLGWPGFGGLPRDPEIRGIADLVARVRREVTSPVALLAQSMGGVIALRVALELPELVRCLVLSVTSGGLDVAALGGTDWRPAFRSHNPGLPDWFERERWDLSESLPRVTAPTLLLWGDQDPISPVAVGQRLAALLPNSELIILPGGDHDLVLERASEVAPHIERHLTQWF